MTNYCFVLDADGKPLSPTKETKGWYMIRKGKAKLVSKYPMTIQLNRVIPPDKICKDEVRCGIDDGGLHVGIALVQKCQTKNKVLFKGTIEHRNDVKHLMSIRREYRIYHRRHKRYRKARFNNRKPSKRSGRIAPSILQKRQAIIRVVNYLNKWTIITSYWLEDVAIDIRALTDGYKPYNWQYQKSNRLDENIRKAVILRDGNKCMECGKFDTKLEVHHIKPKRLYGSNTLDNLITLCGKCHKETVNKEELYMEHFFEMINTSNDKYLNYASHVMIGKQWLREQLLRLGDLHLTNGGDTANKRIDWNIGKTHSNDAICITSLKPYDIGVKEWIIKPMRRQSKAKSDNVLCIKHRDLIEYKPKTGNCSRGYDTSIFPESKQLSFRDTNGKTQRKVAARSCKVLWRYSKIYWFDDCVL